MRRKQIYQVLSIALLLTGALLVANPEPNITGAVIGAGDFPGINPLIGVILITLAATLVIASKEEDPAQAAVEKFEKQYRRVEQTEDTIKADYLKAIADAMPLLKEKGLVNYELLKKEDIKNKYTGKITNVLAESGKQLLGIEKDQGDNFNQQWFVSALYGIQQESLNRQLDEDYTAEGHLQTLWDPKNMQRITQHFKPYITSGIDPKYQKDIIKKKMPGLEDKLDLKTYSSRSENLQNLGILYDIHKHRGGVTKGQLRELGLDAYMPQTEYKKAA